MSRLSTRLCIVAALLLLLAPCLSAQFQDVHLSTGSKYVPVKGVAWGPSFNVAYVLVPVQPEVGVCFYIVNNNPTSAHIFSVTVFQSADGSALDYSNNKGRYQSIGVNGLPANPQVVLATPGVGSTIAGYSGTTAAAQIAFVFSGSTVQAGTPDTADIFFVQTTSQTCGAALTALFVQGAIPSGNISQGENPILIAGTDQSNFVQTSGMIRPDLGGSGPYYGIPMGGVKVSSGTSSTAVMEPNGTGAGPLWVAAGAAKNGPGGQVFVETLGTGGTCTSTSRCPGLYTSNAGFTFQFTVSNVGLSGSNTALWQGSNDSGVLKACWASLQTSGSITGTTPTLDVFVQDSPDNAAWDDRLHFAQVTTSNSSQAGSFTSSVGSTPHALANGTIAASTEKEGAIGLFGRVTMNVTGTTPNYPTVTVTINCQ